MNRVPLEIIALYHALLVDKGSVIDLYEMLIADKHYKEHLIKRMNLPLSNDYPIIDMLKMPDRLMDMVMKYGKIAKSNCRWSGRRQYLPYRYEDE